MFKKSFSGSWRNLIFKNLNMATSSYSSWINALNKFCYVCDYFIVKSQSRPLTKTLKKAYSLHFDCLKLETRIKVEFLIHDERFLIRVLYTLLCISFHVQRNLFDTFVRRKTLNSSFDVKVTWGGKLNPSRDIKMIERK